MATDQPTPALTYDDVPGSLPQGTVPQDHDHVKIAQLTIDRLNNLKHEDLTDGALWRDMLSLTDTYRTFNSADTVFETFSTLSKVKNRSTFTLGAATPHLVQGGASSWLNIDAEFTIQDGELIGRCAATVSALMDSNNQLKIWMIRTWLEHYEGHGHPDHLEPIEDSGHVATNGRGTTNIDQGQIFDTIIAGGGQGGLGLAGRLKALDVSYILFDNRPEIGDSWAQRYESLSWHTIKEFGNLPFGRTFEPADGDLLPAKRIGAGYKAWAEKYGLNAQAGTKVDSATWDGSSQVWTVHTSGEMGQQEWKSKNLVLSIGQTCKTSVSPDWAAPEKVKASGFKGTIIHSVNYREPSAFAGKRGVVIGTANTAHDIAEDMANVGMHTTMVQRSPTFVIPVEMVKAFHSRDYHLDKPTAVADRESLTMPNKIKSEMANPIIWGLIEAHPEKFDALEKAGFRVDRKGSLMHHVTIRYGGHYVDIGSCDRIIKGEIKVKGASVKALTEDGLLFDDGSEIKVDLVVLCTGFEHDFRKDAAEIVGWDVAKQMGAFGGIDSEGEIQGLAKKVGHPHLYYHSGEVAQSRFYSRFLALLLQKEKLGQAVQPYLDGK